MTIKYQEINEILAKGTKTYPSEIGKEIKKANSFLIKNNCDKPLWLEDFLQSNRDKMIETIYRATREEGMASLGGYKEGYFNEIVQNANDLHCGNSINIRTYRSGNIYTLECEYKDTGFKISNIYGFLNREMSDKSAESGQTGKFGIGIKSFFQFVSELSIISNVKLSFKVHRVSNAPDKTEVSGDAAINKNWNGESTVLRFSFDANHNSEFNTSKLIKLVDYLNSYQNYSIKDFFFGDEENLVFDIRSLIFMAMNDKHRGISNISFEGTYRSISLNCKFEKSNTIDFQERLWNIKKVNLSLLRNGYEDCEEYLLISQGDYAFAFPLGVDLDDSNRYYSTYFLKEDNDGILLPSSTLIHSKFANMHRTDLGDSTVNIAKAYEKISEKLQSLFRLLCSREVSDSPLIYEISDVFHSLLYCYGKASKENYEESPLNIEELTAEFLPKTFEGESKPYVVVHKEVEAYEKYAYSEGDIKEQLRGLYLKVIEKGEVTDYDELVDDSYCIDGVQRIYSSILDSSEILEENESEILYILNLFPTVANFIGFRITGNKPDCLKASDGEIDKWLLKCKEEFDKEYNEKLLLTLLGRYRLNDAISYNGDIKVGELSFKDYLFNASIEAQGGVLSKLQNQEFDKKYSLLKQELLSKRLVDNGNEENKYNIRCIKPYGRSRGNWDRTFDYYYIGSYEVNRKQFSQPLLLLERLAEDYELVSFIRNARYNETLLFEKEARGLHRRDYCFANSYVVEQQIIDMGTICDVRLSSFKEFLLALEYKNSIKANSLRSSIKLSCNVESIDTQSVIEELLPELIKKQESVDEDITLDMFKPEDLLIKKINENTNNEYQKESSNFIEKLTGFRIHLYRFDSKSRKSIISYSYSNYFNIKIDSKSSFRKFARYSGNAKDIFVFYDNFSGDINRVISLILKELQISEKTLELMNGYIYNGNTTKTLNYTAYIRSIAKVKRKLVLDWSEVDLGNVGTTYDNEVLYRILTARGSYDIFCPICADIPSETIDFDDKNKKKHSRKIVIMENENKETRVKAPYIITVCCSSCFEKLKNTLSSSEFDGKRLIISTQLAHGQHEKLINKQFIELSPANIEVIKNFKFRK